MEKPIEKRKRELSLEDIFGDKTWSASQQRVLMAVLHRTKNVFITGAGGVGKSEVIRQIRQVSSSRGLKVAVVAHTGIAAITIDGQTLFSFMHFNSDRLKKSKEEIAAELCKRKEWRDAYRSFRILIIDEISMVDPAIFEIMDHVLQIMRGDYRPFGGLQLVLVGDFFQLPPPLVMGTRKYVFQSDAFFRAVDEMHDLKEMWRQNDPVFVNVLNRIRRGEQTQEDIDLLNTRVEQPINIAEGIEATQLYSRNIDVDRINATRLEKIEEPMHSFEIRHGIYKKFKKSARSSDILIKLLNNMNVLELHEPRDKKIPKLEDYYIKPVNLKVGSQVMLNYNLDTSGGLVNGSRGTVIGFSKTNKMRLAEGKEVRVAATEANFEGRDEKLLYPDEELPIVRFAKRVIEVPYVKYSLEEEGTEVYAWRIALKLAWATTIHKSQSLTMDAVEAELADCFEPGMAYVALSRIKAMDNLRLKTPVKSSVFRADPLVIAFYDKPFVLHKAEWMASVRDSIEPAADT